MKSEMPLVPAGRAGDAGEDEVDDVVGEVVVAGGDEDLLAGDAVAAVVLRLGPGAEQADVGAGVRLGQVHGAGPLAGDELRQVGGLLRLGAVGVDRGVGAVGQRLVHDEGDVGRGVGLADGGGEDVGQALAAEGGVAVERRPAAVAHQVEGGAEAARGADDAVLQAAALAVADRVQRARGRRRRSCRLPRGSRRWSRGRARRSRGRRVLHREDVVQHEGDVAERGGVGHGRPSVIRRCCARRASARPRRAGGRGRRSRGRARRAAPPSPAAGRGRARRWRRAGVACWSPMS